LVKNGTREYFEGKLEYTNLITSISSAIATPSITFDINESPIIHVVDNDDEADYYIEYEDKYKKSKNISENKEVIVPEITWNRRLQDIEDEELEPDLYIIINKY